MPLRRLICLVQRIRTSTFKNEKITKDLSLIVTRSRQPNLHSQTVDLLGPVNKISPVKETNLRKVSKAFPT